MKNIRCSMAILLLCNGLLAQNISGNLSLASKERVRLYGFNGFDNYQISENAVDSKGSFLLRYSKKDTGMGYLIASDEKPYFVVLSGEDIDLKGEKLGEAATIEIKEGKENQAFAQYAAENFRREQALSAWDYLEKKYAQDPLFSSQNIPIEVIRNEKQRIKNEEAIFFKNLPKDSYVGWYLPIHKLVSSVSDIAQYRTEEIPATVQAFRGIDYTDSRLYKSGLYKDILDSHYWLLENSGKPSDAVYTEMGKSIDAMINTLAKDQSKLNEITKYLFDLFEKHSLFQAAEHLSLKVLSEECACRINTDLSKQLEGYRVMKVGNKAPDFKFPKAIIAKSDAQKLPGMLSEVGSLYTLVVFGSSWCPQCVTEMPQIESLYSKWKKRGIEVVLVSLDTDQKAFADFASSFSFISVCDYQKWESPIVKNYYVNGTPSLFLLDKNRKILLKPESVKQMDAWTDLNLKDQME